MKKFITFFFSVVMLISLCACGNADAPTTSETLNTPLENDEVETSIEASDFSNSSDYDIEILDYTYAVDYEGQTCIAVRVNFINNSTETVCFWGTISSMAFQNGIELESSFPSASTDETEIYTLYENQDIKLRPGAAIDVVVFFVLRDETAEVEIEFHDFFDWDGEDLILYDTISLN